MAAKIAVVLAALTIGHHPAHQRFQHVPRGCAKHFTVPMARRAMRAAFGGDRPSVTVRQRKRLHWYIRCQWNTLHRPKLNRELTRMRRAWHRRMDPPFQTAFVSWYDDSGTHCCGVYATDGVAVCGITGVCVPQGTKIEFCDHGCVIAVADDHGPYVAGRSFDLNQNTAQAIGFSGLGEVKYRIISS
jgi:hypothetical protein